MELPQVMLDVIYIQLSIFHLGIYELNEKKILSQSIYPSIDVKCVTRIGLLVQI